MPQLYLTTEPLLKALRVNYLIRLLLSVGSGFSPSSTQIELLGSNGCLDSDVSKLLT